MKLTEQETAQARQLAADLGADPADVIAAGEEAKTVGYRQAHQAATATMARATMARGGLSAYPGGPAAQWEAEAGG
jgi:hypothetical protein